MSIESIQQRLAALKHLKDSEGRPLITAVLSAYEQSSRSAVLSMRRALADGDFPTLKQSAHTLGGAAATLGLQDVFDQCKVLQKKAKREQAEYCRQSLTKLTARCRQAEELLAHAARELEGAEDDPEIG